MATFEPKLYVKDGFFDEETSNLLFESCLELLDQLDVNPEIIVMGKKCNIHRSVGFFSNDASGYKYSGQETVGQPLTPELEVVLELVNDSLGACYNGILVNYYADGDSYIGTHSDNEKGLDPKVGVAMISLGASRKFRIRPRAGKGYTGYPTGHGQLMVMPSGFQQLFKHEVPVEKTVRKPRISLTFRCHS